jgi:cytochrome b6-f complex iron-sulfur subunit
MDRKEFIKKVAVGGSILFFAPTIIESCSKENIGSGNDPGSTNPMIIDLTSSKFSTLNTIGGYGYSGNVIIIHTAANEYIALSKICTHQNCTVDYNKSAKILPCYCHGSEFNLSGNVIRGPAQRNLKKYNVEISGNTLIIT